MEDTKLITIYGYTILVDLALLAIVIAIFVFAVTIYRSASELCIKEQQNAADRRKELIESRKTELTRKLQTIRNGASINEVKGELDNLDKEIRKIDKSVLKFINKAKSLTARNLVFVPGSLFIVSIIGAGAAIALSGILQTIMWGLSLLFLGSGLYFTCQNIHTTEFFSNSIDLSTLMEKALANHAHKMKPIVSMLIRPSSLKMEHGTTHEIEYLAFLEQGPIGRNAKVRFLATEKLDFPEEEIKLFGFYKTNMTNAKYFVDEIGDVNAGVNKLRHFKVKAPDAPGEYAMSHWIICDEFSGEEQYFTIKVV